MEENDPTRARNLSRELVYTEGEVQAKLAEKDSDNNDYSTKKSVAQNHLNVSGIQLLISIILSVFSNGDMNGYRISLIVLCCISINLQIFIFILVTYLASSKTEDMRLCILKTTATSLNNLVTSLSGILLIVTCSITLVATYAKIGTNVTAL